MNDEDKSTQQRARFLGKCALEKKPLVIAFPQRNELRILIGDTAFACDLNKLVPSTPVEITSDGEGPATLWLRYLDALEQIKALKRMVHNLIEQHTDDCAREQKMQRKIVSFVAESAQLRAECGHPMVAATASDLREMAANGLVQQICAV